MADYNSSLPVRTENAGDVIVKVGDRLTPSQQLAVDANGKVTAIIEDGGNVITVDGTVEIGATSLAALESITVQNGSGGSAVNIQDGGNSITVDGTVELGATTLAALESITVQNGSGASAVNIQDGGNSLTVDAVDLDIRNLVAATDAVAAHIKDATGTAFSESNPLPVSISDSAGDPIHDFLKSAAVAAAASVNHDYTVTSGKTLYLKGITASASGKAKYDLQVESGVATGIFASRAVMFNSTANPNCIFQLPVPLEIGAGVKVRVTRTNLDKDAQDLYSVVIGTEKA